MKTKILDLHSGNALEETIQILKSGGIVAIPTETVYGLAANALDTKAVQRIFEAKGRPKSNPVICHVSDWDMATQYVLNPPKIANNLAEAFWPGPLTMIFESNGNVTPLACSVSGTVAIRCPSTEFFRSVIRLCDFPIAAPSANKSNSISPTQFEHVLAELNGKIDAIVNGPESEVGIESTVLDLTIAPPSVLRFGAVTLSQLSQCIGFDIRHLNILSTETTKSPGLMSKHYSPKTPLICIEKTEEVTADDPIITFDNLNSPFDLSSNPVIAAKQYYSLLRKIDNMGYKRIFIILPPNTEEWAAIRDRVLRASSSG